MSVGGLEKLTPADRLLRITKRQATMLAELQRVNNELISRIQEAEAAVTKLTAFIEASELYGELDEYNKNQPT
jgi:hypothetical protein